MVCFEMDFYMFDQDKPIWFVDLSDGTRVFGDDNRPGLEPNAWKRLNDYLYTKKLHITMMWISFRSNHQQIGYSEYGYMFRKGLMANISDGINYYRYICGLITENNKIDVQVWQVPEMLKIESEAELRDIEGHEESIIWNLPIHQEKYVLHNIT
jgi:hypothetical protein